MCCYSWKRPWQTFQSDFSKQHLPTTESGIISNIKVERPLLFEVTCTCLNRKFLGASDYSMHKYSLIYKYDYSSQENKYFL